MKQLRMWVGTLWILSGLLVTSSWPDQAVYAAELAASACRLAAVHGSYEFVAPATVNVGGGTVIAIPDHLLYASPAAFASRGTLTFDDASRVFLTATADLGGQLNTPRSYSGVYVIHANCSMTATFRNGTHVALKLVGNGLSQILVSTTPGFVLLRSAPTLKR